MSDAPPELPSGLPDRVAARVVAFAADALGALAVEHVPPALRQVARFAPQRRARLGGQQILSLLDEDADFREHLAVQVRARRPDAVAELAAATETPDAAALAVLERSEGWADLVARVGEQERAARQAGEVDALRAQADVARRRAEEAAEELRTARVKAKEDLDRLRADNADLRRKLGETRAELRRARAEAQAAGEHEREAAAAEASATGRAEAELRRLRARVETLEGELGRSQRSVRSERDEATLRARLLLDTLVQASQGLRQELALPVVEGEPADRVVAAQSAAPAGTGVRTPSGNASLAPEDPELLRRLLELPRAHVVVDGYNVTKTAWPEASLELQRDRLLRGAAGLVARSGATMSVVFDAAHVATRPVVTAPRGVRVLFSDPGQIADDLIRDLVAAEPPGRVVVVVTDDRAVLADVRRQDGVRTVGSLALARLVGRV